MAKLFPDLAVIKRQKVQPTKGEEALINFLVENFDDTYEVFYQPFINGDQPDVALLRKGSGLLLIEVKDWNLRSYHLDDDANWRLNKNGAYLKSPLKQVEAYKANLFNLHSTELFEKKKENKNAWATINCAVYFHDAKESELKEFVLNGSDDEKFARYRRFVGYIGLFGNDSLNIDTMNKFFSKIWMNRRSRFFDDSMYASIRRYVKPPVHQIEDGKEIIYSKEQKELIRSEIRPRRKIKGVAGAGKTLVLAKRAVESHKRTNEKVLILTYNLSLKNYIHDRINDVREEFAWNEFYITNYHQFFKTEANNCNLEIHGLGAWQDVDFFRGVETTKFDTILIDEIQDYKQEWIDVLSKNFMHEKTELVVFGDEKQNIYERPLDENQEPVVRTIPGSWNKTLNTSHRFSSDIGNIALKFQKTIFKQKYTIDDLKVVLQPELSFTQRIIEYHHFHSHSSDIIVNTLYKLLERNEIHSSDVGLLGAKVKDVRELDYYIRKFKKEKTTTTFESQEEFELGKTEGELDKLRRFKKNHFWMKTGTVKLSTTHSFKGWEIDTLVLIITKEKNETSQTNAELIYTALTRAKRNLIIFNLGNQKYGEFFMNEIQSCYEHG